MAQGHWSLAFALLASAYHQYLKLTGATIDLDQFRELYGFRHPDSSIRIAPAVDRWFDEPKNADERAIKELIDRHRAEAVARLEGEVFAQRKRLADAERKLQAKTTNAAAEVGASLVTRSKRS